MYTLSLLLLICILLITDVRLEEFVKSMTVFIVVSVGNCFDRLRTVWMMCLWFICAALALRMSLIL